MNKAIVLLVVLCVVAVSSESMNNNVSDSIVLLEEGQQIHAKTSFSRSSIRAEINEAFVQSNLDSEWLERQEMLETQTEGSGYGEMKEIMEKVDELEKKINGRLAEDLKYITEKRGYCKKSTAEYSRDLSALTTSIQNNNSLIQTHSAKIETNLANRATSRLNVAKWESEIQKLSNLRKIDVDGYKLRTLKRQKEIKVLEACNNLVCTEFSDFKDTDICKDILTYGTKIEDHQSQVSKESLVDLLKKADIAAADYEKKKAAEEARDKENIAVGKAVETLKVSSKVASPKEEVSLKIQALVEILQNSDLPPHVYQPARRIIMMIRTGAAAAGSAEPTKDVTVTPTKADQKEMSLPESLVNLLHRVVNDQKRETLDYMEQLSKYHTQITDAGNAVASEVSRQQSMANVINDSNVAIDIARNDNARRATQIEATNAALTALNASCRKEFEDYNKRREGRLGELVNVEKLRSLLRVLQESDLPKCKNDCTNPDQGKCIWKGLYGTESYCACKKGFYGDACEFRMCPGPNGVLYRSTDEDVCSRRGKCNNDAAKGTCTCSDGYYHGPQNACEFKVCPGNGNCNSKGRCDNVTGICQCYNKYYGRDCSRTKCLGAGNVLFEAENRASCSGNGACNMETGVCTCSNNYQGEYCQSYRCPNNCNGRGSCNARTGNCECNGNFYGPVCEYQSCPENCGGAGACDANSGRCNCYNGYSGPSCRPVQWGNLFGKATPASFTSNDKIWEWAMCPDQYLMAGFIRGSFNENLRSISGIYCVRPHEGANVVPLGQCYELNVRNAWAYNGGDRMRIHWAQCDDSYYLRGILRSPANGEATIDNIERGYCCRISDSDGVMTSCAIDNWWSCLDNPGGCPVAAHRFQAGFGRTHTNNKVWNIEEGRSCQYKRSAISRQLP